MDGEQTPVRRLRRLERQLRSLEVFRKHQIRFNREREARERRSAALSNQALPSVAPVSSPVAVPAPIVLDDTSLDRRRLAAPRLAGSVWQPGILVQPPPRVRPPTYTRTVQGAIPLYSFPWDLRCWTRLPKEASVTRLGPNTARDNQSCVAGPAFPKRRR